MNTNNKIRLALVVVSAVCYQIFLKSFLFTFLGIGRTVQPIADFPHYQCRRIEDPRLQACEDMWLSEKTRQLFLACSDPTARTYWMPNVNRLNASARSIHDAIIALDVDKPKGSSFRYRTLKTPNRLGVLHLIALTGEDTAGGDIRLYLNNAKPTLDPTTNDPLNNVAANYTIEAFTTTKHATKLTHIASYHHPEIKSPNNIALFPSGDGGFYISNDHGTARSGWRHELAPYINNGDVTYCSSCSSPTSCRIVATNFAFPNGLLTGQDGLLYVPSTYRGNIQIFRPSPSDHSIEKVGEINVPYPIDNLSQDRKGDIWIAALPKPLQVLAAFGDPLNKVAPATILRARKIGKEGHDWEVEKVLEDRDGEVLPGATTAVHDVKTGRVFVSGVTAPFVTVCEPKR
ncbi:hypothetical protein DOTSEDRAFT_142053, partial [Dothistroma septosporum NZE10]